MYYYHHQSCTVRRGFVGKTEQKCIGRKGTFRSAPFSNVNSSISSATVKLMTPAITRVTLHVSIHNISKFNVQHFTDFYSPFVLKILYKLSVK